MTTSVASSMNSTERNPRFVGLQIYRGFAALLVLLFHCSGIVFSQFDASFAGNVFFMGNAGVDFFFVLSGFLITFIHRKDIGHPEQFRKYFFKRVIRVLPVYWLITLIVLPVYFVNPKFGQGDETSIGVIVGSLLLIPMHRAPILVAGWTLIYEMLFYTIFGFLIVFGWRWLRYVLAVWVVAVVYTCILHFNDSMVSYHPLIKTILWPQNLEFMMGCLAAYLAKTRTIQLIPRSAWYVIIGLLSVVFMMMCMLPDDFGDLSKGKHTIVYSLLSFGIVLGLSQLDSSNALPGHGSKYWFTSLLSLLGDVSYSLYLLHAPLISLLFKLVKKYEIHLMFNTTICLLSIVVIIVGLSCIFHRLIEVPLLKLCRNLFLAKSDR